MASAGSAQTHFHKSEDFESVERAEWLHWDRHKSPAGEYDEKLIGLALSGGGIRSASFALGVMQALYSFHAFDKFNYLSTVSGGGYIGGALTYFRNTLAAPGAKWFPFGYHPPQGPTKVKTMGARTEARSSDANELARKIVAYLRQHASYMTPSREFGRPALAAGVLRGLVSTFLPYFAILSGFFGVLVWVGFFDQQATWEKFWHEPFGTAGNTTETQPAASNCPGVDCAAFLKCLAELFAVAGDGSPEACTALAKCLGASCAEPEKKASSFYLGFIPGTLAVLAGIALLFAFLLSSVFAGIFHATRAAVSKPEAGYKRLIDFYSSSGQILLAALVFLALSTLPWVHGYLNSLWAGSGGMPADFTALFATIGGAIALLGRLRSVLGGEKNKPSPLRAVGMAVAGIVFIYGLLLLAYGTSKDLLHVGSVPDIERWDHIKQMNNLGTWMESRAWVALWPSAAVLIGGLIIALFININLVTQHRIYRDRLMEIFCAEKDALESGEWRHAVTAQSEAGWLTEMNKQRTPYHLINACLVTADSNKRRYRGRGGDNFILSPLFYGSDATGWVKTETAMKSLSLPTAVAVSGAALNAHAGPHGTGLLRNKAYSALLSLLGLNLGLWLRNPKEFEHKENPFFHMPTLLKPGLATLTGRDLNENGAYVQLSDGGHFENLGIYELVRRKVDFLWISDAGQDSGFSFEDLANAIERVRVDFGVNLRFQNDDYDLSHLIPGSATSDNPAGENFIERYRLATRGYAIGTIEYPDEKKGVVVYVKSTLTRGLPGDLYGYKSRNGDYPHQTTLDQFFDEDQFEAYRELGYRLTAQLFRDIKKKQEMVDAPNDATLSDALDSVIEKLDIRLAP